MGVLFGYRKTLRYLFGIVTGFFLVLLLCGWVSGTLLDRFSSFESWLRWVGAGYILWLALQILRSSYSFDAKEGDRLGFTNGLLLQLLNPKALIYGLTVFSTFLAATSESRGLMFLAAIFLATVGFAAVSTWTLFGSGIRTHLRDPTKRRLVNVGLSLLLVYTAVELSGIT